MTPLCRKCVRLAAALATDVDATDPLGYAPVCMIHVRVAIKNGMKRSAQRPAGYRTPVSILPISGEGEVRSTTLNQAARDRKCVRATCDYNVAAREARERIGLPPVSEGNGRS